MKKTGHEGPAQGAELFNQTLDSTSVAVPSTDLPDVRDIYWRFARLGHRLPAQLGVIVLRGRAKT